MDLQCVLVLVLVCSICNVPSGSVSEITEGTSAFGHLQSALSNDLLRRRFTLCERRVWPVRDPGYWTLTLHRARVH